jgi:hypothetical protein
MILRKSFDRPLKLLYNSLLYNSLYIWEKSRINIRINFVMFACKYQSKIVASLGTYMSTYRQKRGAPSTPPQNALT